MRNLLCFGLDASTPLTLSAQHPSVPKLQDSAGGKTSPLWPAFSRRSLLCTLARRLWLGQMLSRGTRGAANVG